MNGIKMGSKVQDTMTAFNGVVVGITYWMFDDPIYAILSPELLNGIPQQPAWLPRDRIELVDEE